MDIRRILVPLSGRFDVDDPDSLDTPALQASVRLARLLDAQVDVLCAMGPGGAQATGWVSWVPDYGMDAVLDAMQKQDAVRRKHARKSYETIIGPEAAAGDLKTAFVEKAGEIGATVGRAGRLADLIVMASSKSRWEQPFRPILDAALRRVGRPVFVVPPTLPETIADRVVIAWNDTIESARALAGAMPLLEKAGSVTVLTCRDDERSASVDPNDVAAYLALHGISAEAITIEAKQRNSARDIVNASLDHGADLLVLGSVIHSRAHSLVYGSLTEEVMKGPKMNALVMP